MVKITYLRNTLSGVTDTWKHTTFTNIGFLVCTE